MPTLDNHRRNQKSFGSNFRRYQPKTTFYDSRGLRLSEKPKYYNDNDRKSEENGKILKEKEIKGKVNTTFHDESAVKISRTKPAPNYESNFSYHAKDR